MIFRIEKLRLRGIVGVNAWERETPQDIVVSVEAEFDAARAVETDAIGDTVNYRTVSKRVAETVESSRYRLLESLAEALIPVVLEDPRVLRATVQVEKPGAIRDADSVSVTQTIER